MDLRLPAGWWGNFDILPEKSSQSRQVMFHARGGEVHVKVHSIVLDGQEVAEFP